MGYAPDDLRQRVDLDPCLCRTGVDVNGGTGDDAAEVEGPGAGGHDDHEAIGGASVRPRKIDRPLGEGIWVHPCAYRDGVGAHTACSRAGVAGA